MEFLISHDRRVLATKICPAAIHSQRRFSRREGMEILQRKPTGNIERMLRDTNELAQRIRRLRFKAGSLDLDFPESKIRPDDHGRIPRIERVENGISPQLVEEFEPADKRLVINPVHNP